MTTSTAAGSRRRWLARACAWTTALVLATGLAGCATTAISENTQLGPNDGVVTVRVVSLHERTLKHLAIQNLDTQQEYKLYPQPPLGGDSYRFTGVVPAGRYETRELYGFDVHDNGVTRTQYTLKVPLARPENRFEVAPGGLVNLRSVVFVPVLGNRFIAAREDTPVAARDWLRHASPGLAARLESGAETTWTSPPPAQEAALLKAQLAFAQTKATPQWAAVIDAQGTPWSVGKLGTVFDLAKGTRYQTETVHQLTTVVALADGRLVAAGEEGYVAVSTPDRKSWRQLATPGSKAAAGLLLTQAPDGTVYLASSTPLGVAVHAADPQAATWTWREVRRIERDSIASSSEGASVAFRSMGQARPAAAATRERLVVYTPDPEWLSSMEFRTGAWEQHKTESRVIRLRGSPEGVILTMSAAPAFWATSDYGKSWFEVDKYLNTTLPVFTSRTEAYVLASPFATWKAPVPALYKSVDAGKTWSPAGELPPNMPRPWLGAMRGYLMFDPAGQRLGYHDGGGSVRWTRDEGKTWR